MRRRDAVALLGGVAAAWPLVLRAQPRKIPRLCFLTFDPGSLQSTRYGAFFEGLRDLGYVQGQTINIDYLTADGQAARYATLATDCVGRGADVIVTSTTPLTQAAKQATQTIPIVMIAIGDPVGTGLVDSLARPGGNVTGLSQMFPSIASSAWSCCGSWRRGSRACSCPRTCPTRWRCPRSTHFRRRPARSA